MMRNNLPNMFIYSLAAMLNGAVQQHHQLQQFSEETLAPSAGVLAWKQHRADGNTYFRNGRAWETTATISKTRTAATT